jgi:hypothetical protein
MTTKVYVVLDQTNYPVECFNSMARAQEYRRLRKLFCVVALWVRS